MVGYKLSKNDWVTPFFVIFRSVREKLLVTVSFDHPVANFYNVNCDFQGSGLDIVVGVDAQSYVAVEVDVCLDTDVNVMLISCN